MSELVEQPGPFVLPLTGELIDLDDPAQVAYGLEQVRETKRILEAMRATLEELLVEESRRQGTKTLQLENGLTARVEGGTRIEWDDPQQLAHELKEAGLPQERLTEAVYPVVEWKVVWKVVDRLARANPDYRAAIERQLRRVPAPFRVSVSRR